MKQAFIAIMCLCLTMVSCSRPGTWQHDEGMVFGTVYSITYFSHENLQKDIESVLQQVDDALSMFNEQSVISSINRGEHLIPHSTEGDMFYEVFALAEKVSADTNGAFDITVAPLVNAWGFGFREGVMPDSSTVDSLRQYVDWKQVSYWTEGGDRGIRKTYKQTMLDCSAIAKGYGCDVVGRMLQSKGIKDYMIEIGGEVVVRGQSPRSSDWRIGVNKPVEDSLSVNGELQAVLSLSDIAMATSGNYRNFYYKDGRKYAHTIDPRTSYPVQHNILSATVLADNCAKADAYATSFMVMGLDSARLLLSQHPDMKAYLIYTDQDNKLAVWHSPELSIED